MARSTVRLTVALALSLCAAPAPTAAFLSEAEVGRPRHPPALVTQGSHYETHMQAHFQVHDHAELHRLLHEAARKAQADAEAVAASGHGTSEYLAWRLGVAHPEARPPTFRRILAVANETTNGTFNGSSGIQPPGLNVAPNLSDINITAVRHASVTPPPFVDWRTSPTVNTPVFDQRSCESCWLWAAADIISIKWSLLSRFLTPVPLSPQHVCDCGFRKCCRGGWPEWTFNFAKLNRGVAPLSAYAYTAKDYQSCKSVNSSLLTGKITGWEKLPASNPTALIKTVSQHPVVVLMFASRSFLRYTGGIWRGTDCPRKPTANHALVVMGFNASTVDPHWIVKNSWGAGWGEGGYARIAMSPSQICGFGREPSIYPTMFRVTTACDAVPGPCGNGTCYLTPVTNEPRCLCPAGFVERLQGSAPKCVTAQPCNVPVNPCAYGTCNNEFDGTYTCTCPSGSVVGSRADGDETCIVNSFQSGLHTTLAEPGDNCTSLAVTYNLTISKLVQMNPFLNCTEDILEGTVLVVGGATNGTGCGGRDVVQPGENCTTFAARNNITVTVLQRINPGLTCPAMLVSKHVCVLPGQLDSSSPYERSCGQAYDTEPGDTCLTVSMEKNVSIPVIEWLNPSLDCSSLSLPITSVCIAPLMLGMAGIECNQTYNVTQADTCFTVAASANLTYQYFLDLNPGIRCTWPHWMVGVTVCVVGVVTPLTDVELEPNFVPVYARTNDTIDRIAARWADKCVDLDGTNITAPQMRDNICWANSWYPECTDRRLSVGAMLLVPCIQNIGASFCPVSSIWVCGTNGVTYPSTACANACFVTAQYFYPCDACSSACSGKSGVVADNYYGTTTGCGSNYMCIYPPNPDTTGATASQNCPVPPATPTAMGVAQRCQYSRVLCSASLWSLAAPTNCNNFRTCMQRQLSGYGMSMSQCPYVSTACGKSGYAIPGCFA